MRHATRFLAAALVLAAVEAGAAPADVIGTEDFAYADGPIAGQTGGTGFDYNTTENDPFIGHTGTPPTGPTPGACPRSSPAP